MILDEILATTRADLVERKLAIPEADLREKIHGLPAPLDLAAALRQPGVSVIAEIKRASPSKGVMNAELAPDTLAVLYASAGAAAISVLTETPHFRGELADLRSARDGLSDAGLTRPLLRKDFVVDSYQLLEARAWGADAVLLIAAALDDPDLDRLLGEALDLGLSPLVEVHSAAELDRALALNPPIVGINNRDLRTFHVDLEMTRSLRDRIRQDCVVVSESGIRDEVDMRMLASLGVDAALVGEALVTADDPAYKLRALMEAGR